MLKIYLFLSEMKCSCIDLYRVMMYVVETGTDRPDSEYKLCHFITCITHKDLPQRVGTDTKGEKHEQF